MAAGTERTAVDRIFHVVIELFDLAAVGAERDPAAKRAEGADRLFDERVPPVLGPALSGQVLF